MWVLGIKLRSSCFLIHRGFLYPLLICVIHQGERRSDESLTFKELAGSGDKTNEIISTSLWAFRFLKIIYFIYLFYYLLKIIYCLHAYVYIKCIFV